MHTEVIRVDGKGRITIPSYIRLLLNVNEGSRILMDIDEVKGVITLRVFQKKWSKCLGTLNKDDLAELVLKTTVISIKCTSSALNEEVYECDMVIDSSSTPQSILRKISCFNK